MSNKLAGVRDNDYSLDEMCRYVGFQDIIIEVGSYCGQSASILSKYCNHLICVDPHKGGYNTNDAASSSDMDLVKSKFLDVVKNRKNISYLQMESIPASYLFKQSIVDLVYIDADHTYESVIQDIDTWLPNIKYSGWLAGHDFTRKTVHTAIADSIDINKVKSFGRQDWCYQLV